MVSIFYSLSGMSRIQTQKLKPSKRKDKTSLPDTDYTPTPKAWSNQLPDVGNCQSEEEYEDYNLQ